MNDMTKPNITASPAVQSRMIAIVGEKMVDGGDDAEDDGEVDEHHRRKDPPSVDSAGHNDGHDDDQDGGGEDDQRGDPGIGLRRAAAEPRLG